jgi:hypothetical protein
MTVIYVIHWLLLWWDQRPLAIEPRLLQQLAG